MPDKHWKLTYGNRVWELNWYPGDQLRQILDADLTIPVTFSFSPRDETNPDRVDEVRIVVPGGVPIILEQIVY
ncbi:hypothetical protein N8D77_14895 [Curtobacterium flaccumfaciens]|uniref:hypothetical protein n=1 Tax=Curtobacterium flaccumfaciens TaxID=2035 RepID=UPI0021CA9C6F|nr:hypothetical protein [Curtobacterium flaccumfaciens]UXN21420.1 hypothetical protein N8D77_14895 [Curtobacterium flaccumfaciens pv. flaccumfaciens]